MAYREWYRGRAAQFAARFGWCDYAVDGDGPWECTGVQVFGPIIRADGKRGHTHLVNTYVRPVRGEPGTPGWVADLADRWIRPADWA